jgi:ABC transporter ATM
VPFLFKYTVDALTADPTAVTPASVAGVVALTPAALIVGYGVARAGAALCNEARNAVFAKVTQGAIRSVANKVGAGMTVLVGGCQRLLLLLCWEGPPKTRISVGPSLRKHA